MISRIAELEAYRTMYREQMASIRRELQQIGVPQTKILSINATHIAMLDNINHIIQLAKHECTGAKPQSEWVPDTPMSPTTPSPVPAVDDGETETSRENTLRLDTAPQSINDVTSDCGDEWHDADEHSSLSLDSAEEATERRTPSVGNDASEAEVPSNQIVNQSKPKRTLLFGDYDNIFIPSTHEYFELVDQLAKDQLRYALAGVENNVWTLFAEDGAMKMYTREETVDGGLPVDPLKAVHQVQGVTALEYMHYFYDDKYKMDWDHTLNGMSVVERISPDTMVLHQKHKTVWPAAPRESLFISHIRRVDDLKREGAHDLYIVCNKDISRADVPVTSSSGVRVGLTVSMICETVITNGKPTGKLSRDDILCNVIYVSQGVGSSIAIVVVVQNSLNREQYQQAQDTVECYAAYHDYPFHYVIVEDNSTLSILCPQKDFMFQRHCVVAHLMSSWQEEWMLFLDADMAVINPNHLIEEYIPDDTNIHLVFYNRIFNHEVMAGSYLVREKLRHGSSSRTLEKVASTWLSSLTNSFDDFYLMLDVEQVAFTAGMIEPHLTIFKSVIVSFELPELKSARGRCEEFWARSRDYTTLSVYEVCIQLILTSNHLEHILILNKSFHSWARDGWLTNSAWSKNDFILHGWQKRRKDCLQFARWHSPLVDRMWNKTLCTSSDAYLNWRYKDSFIESKEAIQQRLNVTIEEVHRDFQSIITAL
ncbi:START domain protein [Necator americanus]|uniref:START domain protein n=1 Tax=Necator americanus TaxID=51031 RepID=W2STG9_NECAM|nr:START domain protein [Necator americanus]ETN73054.1 START domain protein [Necator americanus]